MKKLHLILWCSLAALVVNAQDALEGAKKKLAAKIESKNAAFQQQLRG